MLGRRSPGGVQEAQPPQGRGADNGCSSSRVGARRWEKGRRSLLGRWVLAPRCMFTEQDTVGRGWGVSPVTLY